MFIGKFLQESDFTFSAAWVTISFVTKTILRKIMKRLIALMFILISSSVSAERYVEYHEDPNALFDTSKNFTNMSNITWRTAKNVTKACDNERKRRGKSSYGYAVEACAFWDKTLGFDTCLVITGKKTSMLTLSHEVIHCFQGHWHEDFSK